jgi:two-component system response regulator YesN
MEREDTMVNPKEAPAVAFAFYPRLKKVKEYVDQHLEDEISLATAAQIAGLEEKYFSTFFHKKTGICFTHWIARARIKRAMDMLSAQDHTITEIAFAVGFRELRSFERTFKKRTGMTPQAFKRSVRPR